MTMTDYEKTLEEMYEEYEAVSYDTETGNFTITMLDDIQRMKELYGTVPVVREFVDREISIKNECIHEVAGFLWFHRGEEYEIDPEGY